MSPSLAQLRIKAVCKSDVKQPLLSSTISFLLNSRGSCRKATFGVFIEAILRGRPPPLTASIISSTGADDLRGPGIGLFLINAAVLCTRRSDSERDAVMDTLKKVTRSPVQAFHTARIVLDRDGSSDVTTSDIKSFFSGGWLHFPAVFFSFTRCCFS